MAIGLEMKELLIFLFMLNFWLMYAGAREDRINGRNSNWLKAHKASWATRDWIIEFIHVFFLPETLAILGWQDTYLFTTLAILVYWGLFWVGYNLGHGELLLRKHGVVRPPWYIWRAWQLLPGLLTGLLGLIIKVWI